MVKQLTRKELEWITSWDTLHSLRSEKQVWTNCQWFRINTTKWKKTVTYFMKKSFLKTPWDTESDYKILKWAFWNIIPNTVFIQWDDGILFSFSEPVIIEFDVLEKWNKNFFIELLKSDPKLLKQLWFFIRKFRVLEWEWKVLDLYGWENLVYTWDDKLKYIDSYVVFARNDTVRNISLERIAYLEEIYNSLIPN